MLGKKIVWDGKVWEVFHINEKLGMASIQRSDNGRTLVRAMKRDFVANLPDASEER